MGQNNRTELVNPSVIREISFSGRYVLVRGICGKAYRMSAENWEKFKLDVDQKISEKKESDSLIDVLNENE